MTATHSRRLEGCTAIVTGSSRGIGLALAQGLLEAGARTVVHGRDRVVAEASASRLREITGGEVLVETFDVTDAEAVDAGIGRIERAWGTPDICVNNAGIQRRAPFRTGAMDSVPGITTITSSTATPTSIGQASWRQRR